MAYRDPWHSTGVSPPVRDCEWIAAEADAKRAAAERDRLMRAEARRPASQACGEQHYGRSSKGPAMADPSRLMHLFRALVQLTFSS